MKSAIRSANYIFRSFSILVSDPNIYNYSKVSWKSQNYVIADNFEWANTDAYRLPLL